MPLLPLLAVPFLPPPLVAAVALSSLAYLVLATADLSEEEVITLRKEVGKYMIEGDLVISLIPLLIHHCSYLIR